MKREMRIPLTIEITLNEAQYIALQICILNLQTLWFNVPANNMQAGKLCHKTERLDDCGIHILYISNGEPLQVSVQARIQWQAVPN